MNSQEYKEFHIEINLLENGIDFILTGIDELFDEESTPRGYTNPTDVPAKSYKYGILHLFSGFLLLLKQRLFEHLPILIYTGNLDDIKQKLKKQEDGKGRAPNTINLAEALERLEIGPKVTFTEEELGIIRRMQQWRNEFEHYKVSGNKHELWSNIVEFLELIDTFLDKQLEIHLEFSTDSSVLQEKIERIESVWKRIEERHRQNLLEDLFYKKDKFKDHRAEILADIEADYYHSKGSFIDCITCSACGDETLIVYGEFAGICSNSECNHVAPITNCDRCGQFMEGYPWEFNLCEYCEGKINDY
jgi:hypothetical protein